MAKQIDQGAKQRLLPWRSERRKGSISHMDRQTARQTASRKPRCCKLLRTLSTLITGHIRAVHMSVMHSYMCKSIVSHGVLLTIGAIAPSTRRQEDSPPPGSQREPWQAIKGDDSRCKQLLVAADEPGDAHPGGFPKSAATPAFELRSHYAQKTITLTVSSGFRRFASYSGTWNAIPSLLQGSRRLRGVLQPPASAGQDRRGNATSSPPSGFRRFSLRSPPEQANKWERPETCTHELRVASTISQLDAWRI
ncbi:hypothetical protein N5P37_004226 [Trichoderma harzianum]|nr:hypothetical protein N5P37_004226 [Trichoderma harzianum]